MSKLTIEISSEEEKQIKLEASRRGLPPDQYVGEIIREQMDRLESHESKDATPGGWPLRAEVGAPESKL